jgi:hypothetical protein
VPMLLLAALWTLLLLRLFLDTRAAFPLAFEMVGDQDMKIAPGPGAVSDRKSRRAESEEAATEAYLHQRKLGNTQRAAKLGTRMAETLIATTLPAPPPGVAAAEYHTQLRVLCAFAVNRALEERAPGSIVAQSALAAFYDTLQDLDPDFYEAISESGAFSLYMYLYRSEAAEPMAFATAFAEVCGHPGSYDIGLYAYRQAYARALGMIDAVDFQ